MFDKPKPTATTGKLVFEYGYANFKEITHTVDLDLTQIR